MIPWSKKYYWPLVWRRYRLTVLTLTWAIISTLTGYAWYRGYTLIHEAHAAETQATQYALTCLNGGRFETRNELDETVVIVCRTEEFNIGRKLK